MKLQGIKGKKSLNCWNRRRISISVQVNKMRLKAMAHFYFSRDKKCTMMLTCAWIPYKNMLQMWEGAGKQFLEKWKVLEYVWDFYVLWNLENLKSYVCYSLWNAVIAQIGHCLFKSFKQSIFTGEKRKHIMELSSFTRCYCAISED